MADDPAAMVDRLSAAIASCMQHISKAPDDAPEHIQRAATALVQDVMTAAKAIETYFLALQLQSDESPAQRLQQENEELAAELQRKDALLAQQRELLLQWRAKLAALSASQRATLAQYGWPA